MNGKKKVDGQKSMCGSNSEEKSIGKKESIASPEEKGMREKESITSPEEKGMSSYTVHNVKDFDLRHIFECGQCFRNRKLAENEYLVAATDRIVTMRTEKIRNGKARTGKTRTDESSGSEDALVNLEISPCTEEEFDGFWKKYLDLDRDYGAIKKRLCRNDEIMRDAVRYGEGIRILGQDLWETIISFIISQNNNIPRIKGCIEKLCRLAGKRIDTKLCRDDFEHGDDVRTPEGGSTDATLLPYAFPGAEDIAGLTLDDLACVRLGYRAKYILSAARTVTEKGLPESEEELLELMGVGPKVANCILLFGMAKYESFPIDVWVKKVMHELYGLKRDDMEAMKRFAAENFGELGGFAQQYLFFYMREKENTR